MEILEKKRKLLKIIKHFGTDAQLDKLQEEINEFIEAIRSGNIKNMEEEYADVAVVMMQLALVLNLDSSNIVNIRDEKIQRTLDRIESGYYEGGE